MAQTQNRPFKMISGILNYMYQWRPMG